MNLRIENGGSSGTAATTASTSEATTAATKRPAATTPGSTREVVRDSQIHPIGCRGAAVARR